MNTPILVVGGAGYIGSHTCLKLAEAGFLPIVYDNLSNGHREFVKWGPLAVGDIRDRTRLDEVLEFHAPSAIIHFAALTEVGESINDPLAFYDNNVTGSLTLLAAAKAAGVRALVFSSTCATYGIPQQIPIVESHPQSPINPYGRTKLMVEQALKDLDRYADLRSVSLRYFNAAGADLEGRIGEWHTPETHALPLAIQTALGSRPNFEVFGSDYETRDGTCVRDYVHVLDLAEAHVRSLQYLLDGGDTLSLNLGTGTGTTVQELLTTVEVLSGHNVHTTFKPRRPGDSPILVANNEMAMKVLQWQPRFSLEEIVQSAWNWHSHLPVK
jgi:UDP-glucose 4-epimerase